MGNPALVAVIPAYNEELVIGSVALPTEQHVVRVIVDDSTDRTAKIARLAGADVIKVPENGGKAKAMMAGCSNESVDLFSPALLVLT